MARNFNSRASRIASLIDGFNSGYSTVGRVLKDRDLRDVADAKPELHTAPKGGKADDLELIWGVGPKLREMLKDYKLPGL